MRFRWTFMVTALVVATQVSAQEKGGGRRSELKTQREKASYSFGMSMGGSLKKQEIDIDIDLLIQGLRDAALGGKLALTDEQAMEAIQAFEKDMVSKQAEQSKKFLADNKKRPGVKTTSSGLQYKILKPGKGPRPKTDDVVSVVYRASFTNGAEFESSGGKEFTTPISQVIPGWQEALTMMDVGSKWQLFIPPDLAYGAEGQSPTIGPNATLVFELELLEIKKPAAGASVPKRNSKLE